jgi:hypothetical protein
MRADNANRVQPRGFQIQAFIDQPSDGGGHEFFSGHALLVMM